MSAIIKGFEKCQAMLKEILEKDVEPEEKLRRIKLVSEMSYKPEETEPTKIKHHRHGGDESVRPSS